ncbi:AP2-like DNA-binding integrase domain-containing protein [Thomasclavelia cocleata]|uniref:AP2-like DNA-binding integrase domain-containing protein n=1 Tax=Thomasclavelia cocleata TaxID=69824 RepID=A0A1I0FP41_9FIRM|nr:AP2-like DNA-binding integrase domain-containing protein [Thomasclavelia cocleata]
MAKDPIKKADNGTYYFRANLGYDTLTGKQIQKYQSDFKTKKEAKTAYSKSMSLS